MEHKRLSANRVVDLLLYSQERRQRRLDFDGAAPRRPALALVTTFRPLTAREVAHRERMVSHMARRKAEDGRQKEVGS